MDGMKWHSVLCNPKPSKSLFLYSDNAVTYLNEETEATELETVD